MSTERRNGGGYERRSVKAEVTFNKLSSQGRVPMACLFNGSTRTYVWGNYRSRSIPLYVEQVRVYSTTKSWGTSRGMEASDTPHVLAGLDAAEKQIKDWRVSSTRPEPVARSVVNVAIDRGDNPPHKVFYPGNLVALLWVNRTEGDDFVSKVELLAVDAAGGVDRFFLASEIGDARKCYSEAGGFILGLQRELCNR